MFHRIRLANCEAIEQGRTRATFVINDACFGNLSVELIVTGDIADVTLLESLAVIEAYASRKMNVARELSIYYLTLTDGLHFLRPDMSILDTLSTGKNYQQKYAKIVEFRLSILLKAIKYHL